MKKADILFVLVILLVILALILVVVNIQTLFPTPPAETFAQSVAPVQ